MVAGELRAKSAPPFMPVKAIFALQSDATLVRSEFFVPYTIAHGLSFAPELRRRRGLFQI
jgi:hypothetical protein